MRSISRPSRNSPLEQQRRAAAAGRGERLAIADVDRARRSRARRRSNRRDRTGSRRRACARGGVRARRRRGGSCSGTSAARRADRWVCSHDSSHNLRLQDGSRCEGRDVLESAHAGETRAARRLHLRVEPEPAQEPANVKSKIPRGLRRRRPRRRSTRARRDESDWNDEYECRRRSSAVIYTFFTLDYQATASHGRRRELRRGPCAALGATTLLDETVLAIRNALSSRSAAAGRVHGRRRSATKAWSEDRDFRRAEHEISAAAAATSTR